MKVGLLGGTFDPIHFGHLHLALHMLEKHRLDQIWLIPAFISPFKTKQETASASDRLKMAKLAVKDIPQIKVLDVEIKREGPSYSIDTVKKIIDKHKGKQFFLIVGSDCIQDFSKWHQVEDLVDLIPILVGARSAQIQSVKGPLKIRNALKKGLTQIPIAEISATDIRQRIKKGLYIKHLIPSKVVDYICKNHLYLK